MSLKDKLSLTHTLALFLTNTVCLPFAVLTHTSAQASLPPSLFTPNFSRQFAFFCSFFSTFAHTRVPLLPMRETPWCPRGVLRRIQIPGSLAVGLRGSRPGGPKVPSFISPHLEKGSAGSSLGEKEKNISQDHRNQGQPC